MPRPPCLLGVLTARRSRLQEVEPAAPDLPRYLAWYRSRLPPGHTALETVCPSLRRAARTPPSSTKPATELLRTRHKDQNRHRQNPIAHGEHRIPKQKET